MSRVRHAATDRGLGRFSAVASRGHRPEIGALVPGALAVAWVLSQIAYP